MPETYNTIDRPSYSADDLRREFKSIQRSIPSKQRPLAYDALPTGSGTWDTGSGTTITIVRALTADSLRVTGTANAGVGAVYFEPTDGMAIRGKTGGTYDFSIVTVAGGYLLRNPTGTANIEVTGSVSGATGFEATAAGAHSWAGRSILRSGATGVVVLLNNAETGFDRLQFGGTSSSFPALQRQSARLDFRLADDSGYASSLMHTLGVTTGIYFGSIGAGTSILLSGGAMVFGALAVTAASATGGAGFRLPHGAAPTSPVDGDTWTTTAGLFVRINGATIGPLS